MAGINTIYPGKCAIHSRLVVVCHLSTLPIRHGWTLVCLLWIFEKWWRQYIGKLYFHTNGPLWEESSSFPLRQNWRHFPNAIFKCIFVNENVWISMKFVPKIPVDNNPALFYIMSWRRPGDKPLYKPMMLCLLTHICVTRPQLVKESYWC